MQIGIPHSFKRSLGVNKNHLICPSVRAIVSGQYLFLRRKIGYSYFKQIFFKKNPMWFAKQSESRAENHLHFVSPDQEKPQTGELLGWTLVWSRVVVLIVLN